MTTNTNHIDIILGSLEGCANTEYGGDLHALGVLDDQRAHQVAIGVEHRHHLRLAAQVTPLQCVVVLIGEAGLQVVQRFARQRLRAGIGGAGRRGDGGHAKGEREQEGRSVHGN